MARGDSHEILRRLDLNLLVVFDALIRFGSITQAADHLGMTQSAASHALKRLRDFFGDPLFIRSGKGVVPTRRAEDVGRSVSMIADVLRNSLLTKTEFDPSQARREITLFLHDYGELVILPALAAAVRAAAPRCSIKIAPVSGESLVRGLEEGWIDLAISGPANFSGEVLQQRLFDADYAVAASRHSTVPEPIRAEDLEAIDQLVIRPVRPDKLPIDTLLVEGGFPRRESVVTPYTMAVPSLLAANPDMIAIVPADLIDHPVSAGMIRRIETDFVFPSVSIFQFWHRRNQSDHFSIWLRSVVRGLFRGADSQVTQAPIVPAMPI